MQSYACCRHLELPRTPSLGERPRTRISQTTHGNFAGNRKCQIVSIDSDLCRSIHKLSYHTCSIMQYSGLMVHSSWRAIRELRSPHLVSSPLKTSAHSNLDSPDYLLDTSSLTMVSAILTLRRSAPS